MDKSVFGNLSYERHSFETDSECLLVALQAALKVQGLSDDSAPLKCIRRLKRSMKKNKIRKYSFSLIPTETSEEKEATPSVFPLAENDNTSLIIKELSSAFGMHFKFASLSSTSSRYKILKVKGAGRASTLTGLLSFQPAVDALRAMGFPSVAFSVLKKKDFKEKDAVGIVVQCIYCDPENGAKETKS